MENQSLSRDERQPAVGGLLLLPLLLCLSAVIAVCIGVLAFVLTCDVSVSIGISGAVVGACATLSWWIAPRLLG